MVVKGRELGLLVDSWQKTRDESIFTTIYESVEKLVTKHVIKYYRATQDDGTRYDQLISDGLFALTKACNSYKVDTGLQFSTYLCTCIDNEIRYSHRKYSRYSNEFSLDTPVSEDGTTTHGEFQENTSNTNTLSRIDDLEVLKDIVYIINSGFLTTAESDIMGVALQGKPQREIGALLGLSQSYCSRLLTRANKKILDIIKYSDSIGVPVSHMVQNPREYYTKILKDKPKHSNLDDTPPSNIEYIHQLDNEILILKGVK